MNQIPKFEYCVNKVSLYNPTKFMCNNALTVTIDIVGS